MPFVHCLTSLYIALILIAACSKADPKPEPLPLTDPITELRAGAVTRFLQDFVNSDGFVVSRPVGWRDIPDGKLDGKGNPANEDRRGEGLLWAGVAMASLNCEEGFHIELAMRDWLMTNQGALIRIAPLGEYAGGREVTMDGALGLYLGIASRIKRCGNGDTWKQALQAHRDYREDSNGKLHPNSAARLDLGFSYPLDLLLHRLGLRAVPHSDVLRLLEGTAASWAWGVRKSRSACYRANLALIAFETVESLGGSISANGRNAFCAATDGMGIGAIDNWCGRPGLKEWIDNFVFNRYEMEFQRCPAWESPDGNGLETPALDLLWAMSKVYDLLGDNGWASET